MIASVANPALAAARLPDGAGPGRPIVALRGVSKVFSNGTVALQNMSLAVAEGEFLSLLGPSGCGKSTVLRIIAGLGEPTSGAVEWPWLDSEARKNTAGGLGFVFQEPTLMPWGTVFDNVWLPLRLRGAVRKPRCCERRIGHTGDHLSDRTLNGPE